MIIGVVTMERAERTMALEVVTEDIPMVPIVDIIPLRTNHQGGPVILPIIPLSSE